MNPTDPHSAQSTILALSSGSLPSGVAVLRLSGPAVRDLLSRIAGALPPARTLSLRALVHPRTGETLDRGLVALFPAPHSFTGEDCAELHAHGSPAGVKALLAALTGTGLCRLADAGEFTRRAFENGKLDLTAIEGLGDLLAAETEAQRRQARARAEGGLAAKAAAWRQAFVGLRAELEAHLDFADEDDVPADLPAAFWTGIAALEAEIVRGRDGYEHGRLTREGLRIVLYGAANAGKSSLLNALAGSDVAIVTDEAGTTRDTKDVAIDLAGYKVIVTDTAGLRATESKAEAAGIALTARAVASADLVLWLQAPGAPVIDAPRTVAPVWVLATKSDLTAGGVGDVAVSVVTPDGISPLLTALTRHIEGLAGPGEPALISHARDLEALNTTLGCLASAQQRDKARELVAEDLRSASTTLARHIGLVDAEDVLDRLFAGFCIGK